MIMKHRHEAETLNPDMQTDNMQNIGHHDMVIHMSINEQSERAERRRTEKYRESELKRGTGKRRMRRNIEFSNYCIIIF